MAARSPADMLNTAPITPLAIISSRAMRLDVGRWPLCLISDAPSPATPILRAHRNRFLKYRPSSSIRPAPSPAEGTAGGAACQQAPTMPSRGRRSVGAREISDIGAGDAGGGGFRLGPRAISAATLRATGQSSSIDQALDASHERQGSRRASPRQSRVMPTRRRRRQPPPLMTFWRAAKHLLFTGHARPAKLNRLSTERYRLHKAARSPLNTANARLRRLLTCYA